MFVLHTNSTRYIRVYGCYIAQTLTQAHSIIAIELMRGTHNWVLVWWTTLVKNIKEEIELPSLVWKCSTSELTVHHERFARGKGYIIMRLYRILPTKPSISQLFAYQIQRGYGLHHTKRKHRSTSTEQLCRQRRHSHWNKLMNAKNNRK